MYFLAYSKFFIAHTFRFGGLDYEAQSAFHTLGELICTGKKTILPIADSCSSLKRQGFFKNSYYNVKEEGQFSKLVFCDMESSGGYDNINEEFIESSETHSFEIDGTIDEIINTIQVLYSQLSGKIIWT